MAKTPDIGAAAPDFTLPGVILAGQEASRGTYTLSASRGTPLVLAFYPGDNTKVCTAQMCSYTSGLEGFSDAGVTVWGISPQDVDSHEGFARKYSLAMPLLADTGRAVTKAYGIGLAGASLRRSVFLVDSAGIVRWKHVALVGLSFPSVDTIMAQVAALAGAG
jgi:peroxiredoxin Q/BCP